MTWYQKIHSTGKKKFSFRGCGWKAVDTSVWSKDKRDWILTIDVLFCNLFGNDFLSYLYDKDTGTAVDTNTTSELLEYNHEQWEKNYQDITTNVEDEPIPQQQRDLTTCAPVQHHAAKKLAFPDPKSSINAPKVIPSTSKSTSSIESPGPVASAEVIEVEECEGDQMQTSSQSGGNLQQGSQLFSALSTAKTRAEIAALATLIPKVDTTITSSVPSSRAEVTWNCPVYSDPYCLVQRPCEAIVEQGEKLLSHERKKGHHPTGVRIRGIGHFSEQGLSVLKKFAFISDTRNKVTSEAQWLSHVTSTPGEQAVLQEILWNRPMSNPVLRSEKKAIDVISFSDLCEERYIDSFVVDTCIGKYIEEARTQGNDNTLYLPTDFFLWMETDDKAFKVRQLAAKASQLARFEDCKQILVPVYMVNHWGLVYTDLTNQQLYFDDGLASLVPRMTLPCLKEALDFLLELHPYHLCLQTKFWHSCKSLIRFGMPSQVPIDRKMIGSGSCGIGVIMASRDFIRNGPACVNNIPWRYCNMDQHRKELMLQILKWSGHDM